MNIPEMIESLAEERDRIQAAIDALELIATPSAVSKPAPKKDTQPESGKVQCKCGKMITAGQMGNHQRSCPTVTGKKKLQLHCKNPGCDKVFTGEVWLRKHELDCACVVRTNGSDAVGRRAG